MARRPNVPAFGNWEKEQGDVPYTVFFEKARQVKGGKIINPNENPDVFSKFGPPAPAPAPAPAQTRAPPPKSKPEPSRDVGDYGSHHKQPSEISGERQMRRPRPSAGNGNSFDRTPPRPQARNAPDSNHGTPGRPRSNSRGGVDGSPRRGAAVPKFGEWDEKNPASADGFTHIFQKVRDEKYTGEVRADTAVKPAPNTGRKPNTKDKAEATCFSWLWR